MEYKHHIKNIFVHPSVISDQITLRIVKNFPDVPVEITETPGLRSVDEDEERSPAAITNSKNNIWITRQEGKFLHSCPGTPGMVCCDYYVLDLVENCPLNCTYCFLQGYLNSENMTIYTNIDDLFKEVETLSKNYPEKLIRIGTGELSDSLVFDDVTGISTSLISFFMNQENLLLELKTKTNQITQLKQFRPKGNIVIGWSVNPQSIIESEEFNSATLKERLESARECQSWGYRIAFHFDPIFNFPGWEKAYDEVVDGIFSTVSAESIAWISLGTFRFFPGLKEIIKRRFPKSEIIYNEHFPGTDGKMRYSRLLREKMYKSVLRQINYYAPKTPVYLCMESAQVWRNVFGWVPECNFAVETCCKKGIVC